MAISGGSKGAEMRASASCDDRPVGESSTARLSETDLIEVEKYKEFEKHEAEWKTTKGRI